MNKSDTEKLLFSIRPEFHLSLVFLKSLRLKFMLSVLGSLAGGVSVNVIIYLWFANKFYWQPFVIFGLLAFIAVSIIHILQIKLVYSQSVYHIYRNKLEYVKNFIIRELEDINFSDIKQIKIKKYSRQKKYKLGTIILTLSNKKKFLIPDISNSDEVYHHLKKLVL